MLKHTGALATPLRDRLDRLAAFEPVDAPVISLYLDLQADQHGRDNYRTFVRSALPDRARALAGEKRRSYEADVERINQYVETEVQPSTNTLALFACSAADGFFEALQLDARSQGHWLFVGSTPHLYPLARLTDQFPRYAALLLDSNSARIFVFSLNAAEGVQEVTNPKTRRHAMGGWSQARYQRHVDNLHLQHIKEVVEVLDRVVREEAITQVVVSAEESARATLLAQLPQHLRERVVEAPHLGIRAPEHDVLARTLEILRQEDATTDAARVAAMLDAWQSGGLAVVGPDDTLAALEARQVEELLIAASPELMRSLRSSDDAARVDVATSTPSASIDPKKIELADRLVALAHQNAARVRFIEDPVLLAPVGGVGAILRFSIRPGPVPAESGASGRQGASS